MATGAGAASHSGIKATLEHHDRAIGQLTVRMGNVETRLEKIDVKMDAGFAAVTAALAQQRQSAVSLKDAVSVVLSLAVLFSMVVGGIIWVTTNQFAGIIARQDSLNTEIKSRLEKHDQAIDKMAEIMRWRAETKRADERTR